MPEEAPSGLNATAVGWLPAAYGEPLSWLGTPPAATENNDTELEGLFAVASRPPEGLNAIAPGELETVKGEPEISVSAPATPTEKTDNWL